ncbi:MAG: rhomboid family intramembrane serine protease, partial [Fibrobacter sp.]|nr:rhomboid family intramembrane serine protease [Fibrobacter sp.]
MISQGYGSNTKAIKGIVIVTLVVYLFELLPFASRFLIEWGSLIPWYTFLRFQIWRLVSYVFLHAPSSPFHILFNMLMLWMFGAEIEERWGTKRFVIFYLICGAGSGLFSLINLFNGDMRFTSVIGASGAVLGVLTIYALYFPYRQVLLFFVLPVNIRIVV